MPFILPPRFIPAYAGNARPLQLLPRLQPVHPRIRGERTSSGNLPSASSGSSPHTRGTPETSNDHETSYRFIPAYAGNAQHRSPPAHGGSVHPRIRGERAPYSVACWVAYGSSPHTRGTLQQLQQLQGLARFIPAYAGNACSRQKVAPEGAVHPRIRGERRSSTYLLLGSYGSSPHTRGTRLPIIRRYCTTRFIPAYAGNAASPGRRTVRVAVHPRIRGERAGITRVNGDIIGSSPHTRGTLDQHLAGVRPTRFIPAYAGNAGRNGRRQPSQPVHPRIRGERSLPHSRSSVSTGSSPHTRGTLAAWRPRSAPPRFIPAYAGNASSPVYGSRRLPVHPRIRGERV